MYTKDVKRKYESNELAIATPSEINAEPCVFFFKKWVIRWVIYPNPAKKAKEDIIKWKWEIRKVKVENILVPSTEDQHTPCCRRTGVWCGEDNMILFKWTEDKNFGVNWKM